MNGAEARRDRKPVVTCAGELEVFAALEEALGFALPAEPCEWRRSLGRPVRSVNVGVRFEAFSPEALPRENQWDAIRHPLFHIYWTECSDVEAYKKNVHDDASSWLKELNARNVTDWLMVVVETFDAKRANKLLPRTTVLDKIRADFAPKQGDRCISVLNPGRQENRTADSWRGLVARIRYLVLVAYARAVSKLEEHVRQQRERRNEPGWHFLDYFRLQEELAETLEALGLHDEALVQYDELDALFSQFVVNGHRGDAAAWLVEFQAPLERWHGLRLSDCELPFRPSLLELRAYMFARQARALLAAGKPFEMAARCLPFLHGCVCELSLLEVSAPAGAAACWLFLACLEVLQACETRNDAARVEAYSLHTAALWAYAGEKVRELGDLCGLTSDGPTSDQLHTAVSLSAGMGDRDGSDGPSPTDRLKEALCSRDAFDKLYLELSELAVGTYKHVGRIRSARLVGRELASFFRSLGQHQKAAAFLNDALKTFESEGWRDLAAQGRRELASCYLHSGDLRKYSRCCAAVAAAPEVDTAVRCVYFDELLKTSSQLERPLSASFVTCFRAVSVNLLSRSFFVRDDVVTARLQIESGFPRVLLCDGVFVSVSEEFGSGEFANENEETSWREKRPADARVSAVTATRRVEYRQDRQVAAAGVSCARPEGGGPRRTSAGGSASAGTGAATAVARLEPESLPVLLTPGANSLLVRWTASRAGNFSIGSVVVRSSRLEFVSPALLPRMRFEVRDHLPTEVRLDNEDAELLAGLRQRLLLTVTTGCDPACPGDELRLRCSKGLSMRLGRESEFVSELRLPLRTIAPFSCSRDRLEVFAEMPAREHSVDIKCPWMQQTLTVPLGFTAPIAASWRLHTAGARKYLQIFLNGRRSRPLRVSNATLCTDTTDVPQDLNPALDERSCVLSNGANLSFMWELRPKDRLKADFSVDYDDDGDVRIFRQRIELDDYETRYVLEARVEPAKGSEFCRAGALCHLRLSVARAAAAKETRSLMYEVLAEQSVWAVCGRTAGVISMDEGCAPQSVSLDVMPLAGGFLPLPLVRLSNYIPADRADHPRLEPFAPGQVYNATKARQVHVLPPPAPDVHAA